MDGTLFDFTDWSKGQPQNISGNDCGAISVQNGQWYSEDCYKNKPFVCLIVTQINTNTTKMAPATLPTTTITTTTCFWGWTYYEITGHCYKVFLEPVAFLTAEDSCKLDGAHLASIHSQNETLFIASK